MEYEILKKYSTRVLKRILKDEYSLSTNHENRREIIRLVINNFSSTMPDESSEKRNESSGKRGRKRVKRSLVLSKEQERIFSFYKFLDDMSSVIWNGLFYVDYGSFSFILNEQHLRLISKKLKSFFHSNIYCNYKFINNDKDEEDINYLIIRLEIENFSDTKVYHFLIEIGNGYIVYEKNTPIYLLKCLSSSLGFHFNFRIVHEWQKGNSVLTLRNPLELLKLLKTSNHSSNLVSHSSNPIINNVNTEELVVVDEPRVENLLYHHDLFDLNINGKNVINGLKFELNLNINKFLA